ncbi:hypothetical protein GN958_ATG11948 [Phytophthora infestans]|uniref:Uncharacterized protein n=1 Tax=Phytophthora infestans TaxID=4787 RepID=A0A8S9UE07_PHYIN|nr:hypothetical protein GN958_ATG11948 [Phytophthora infestans]
MSRHYDEPISTDQCKNKIKWLKREWAEYNADIRATGSPDTLVAEPPALDLIL